jgi:chromosomal replication initiation ATPase DnaA
MLSGILKGERATEVNIAIMRAFVQFRRAAGINADLATKLGQLEEKFDDLKLEYVQQSKVFLQAIQSLTTVDHSQWATRLPADSSSSETALPSTLKERAFDCALQLNVQAIQRAVAKYYGLQVQDLKTTRRIGKIALARQIGMYLTREKTGMGFREIGVYFGGKDHTTVLHACRKIKAGIEKSTNIHIAVESVKSLLS